MPPKGKSKAEAKANPKGKAKAAKPMAEKGSAFGGAAPAPAKRKAAGQVPDLEVLPVVKLEPQPKTLPRGVVSKFLTGLAYKASPDHEREGKLEAQMVLEA